MKFKLKSDQTDVEQIAYFEVIEDSSHIDLVLHTPRGLRFNVLGIRKRTGELVRYSGLESNATGLSVGRDGKIKEGDDE